MFATSHLQFPSTKHKVLLDGQTLYINKDLAEAIGWKPYIALDGLKLLLHGWEPSFFTITVSGDNDESPLRCTRKVKFNILFLGTRRAVIAWHY